MLHTLSPASQGLFVAGIAESGFPMPYPLNFALNYTLQIASRLGCTGSNLRNCLRNKTVDQIVSAQDPTQPADLWLKAPGWLPVIDGYTIPAHPFQLIAEGKLSSVPVIAGINTDEGSNFIYITDVATESAYKQWVYNALVTKGWGFNDSILETVYQMYPPSSRPEQNKQMAALLTNDFLFTCGTRNYIRGLSQQKENKGAYFYRFDHAPCQPIPEWGVYHLAEIPYVYDEPQWLGCQPFSPTDQTFSESLGKYWTNLIKSGNPNQPASNSVIWPPYNSSTNENIYLNTTITMEKDFRSKNCDFWDTIYPSLGQ